VGYCIGVDLGTTFTAAATARDGRVDIATLGQRAIEIPSVAYLGEDGGLLFGEAAQRRSATDPERVARQFKRRMGDPVPIMLGPAPYSAHLLMARLLDHVVTTVRGREGADLERVMVTCPANWGRYKLEMLEQVIAQAGVGEVGVVTEPAAAAAHYASLTRVAPGAVLAVYDLGGGTFDATILRATATGFELLGRPQGIEHLGGVDFDEAVFSHVRSSVGLPLEDLDGHDPTVVAAVARLRRDCVEAKEDLSVDTQVTIPVGLPAASASVRLTRRELEEMIGPTLTETVATMRRALDAAGVAPSDLTAMLLVGGSSRIPLVTQMLAEQFGRPIAIDVHPKHAVALGAARLAMGDTVPERTSPPAVRAPGAAPLARPVAGERWPTSTEYATVVQHPRSAFIDPQLRAASVVVDNLGLPSATTGQNAVVFRLDVDGQQLAVRCFLSPPDDGPRRYQALERHLQVRPCENVVAARWIDDGVVLDGVAWPVVVMPWVRGLPLDAAVADLAELPDGAEQLRALAGGWRLTMRHLGESGMDHGDLQHGNVLVDSDLTIRLVDLDSVWVPDAAATPPNENGHPNYQHRLRTPAHWGEGIDLFSAMLIDVSVRAFAADPGLLRRMTGENLVLTRHDLEHPGETEAWSDLMASPDPEVVELAAELLDLCRASEPPKGRLEDRGGPVAVAGNGGSDESVRSSTAELPAMPASADADWWVDDPDDGDRATPPLSPPPPDRK
jgi:actin-like ATPase involved in cell morphogenesis